MDFILQPTNLALLAIAIISGLMLLQPALLKGKAKHVNTTEATQLINKSAGNRCAYARRIRAWPHSSIQIHSALHQYRAIAVGQAQTRQTRADRMRERHTRTPRRCHMLDKQGYADVAVLMVAFARGKKRNSLW